MDDTTLGFWLRGAICLLGMFIALKPKVDMLEDERIAREEEAREQKEKEKKEMDELVANLEIV